MPDQQKTEQQVKQILSILEKAFRQLSSRRVISVIAILAAALFSGFIFLIIAEKSLYLPGTLKSISLLVIFLLASGAAFWFYRNLEKPSFRNFYEDLLQHADKKSTLNAIDLYLDKKQHQSRFYLAALSSNLDEADTAELDGYAKSYLSRQKINRFYKTSVSFCIASLVFFISVAAINQAETLRTLHFWSGYVKPNPFSYSIAPADTTIEHGSSVQVNIRFADNRVPGNVTLEFKTGMEEEYRQRLMQPLDANSFVSPEIDLINDITYRVEMDGFLSGEYSVIVQLQPRFDELAATITPPSYTGLSTNRLEYPFTQVNLYPGSTLFFEGKTNQPVDSIALNRNGTSVNMEVSPSGDNSYSLRVLPENPDTLRFEMVNNEGLKNRNPYRTVINIRDDQYPVVVIREPAGTVMVTDPGLIDIFYQATDDFGLTRAELHWQHQRAFVERAGSGSKSLDRPRNGRVEQIRWDLGQFDLRPRDQLAFTIRVWDNDEVSGYKMGESQQIVIQVPSLSEYFDELDNRERDIQGELDQISDNFNTMEQEYKEFLDRMIQNPEGGFEESQMLEDIQERQGMIDEAVRDLNEKFDRMRSEIESNDRISDETRSAYQELQQLMSELDDPALREAMEELQRAIENLSPHDLERALENVSFNEQLYRERIERTVELFKRLKMNSDLDKLARQYEDMADRMLMDHDSDTDELSQELDNIQQDLDQVSSQLDQLDQNPPRRSEETLMQLKEEGQRELENIREQLRDLMNRVNESESGEQVSESGANDGENGQNGDNGENRPAGQIQEQQQQIGQQMQAEAERFRQSIQQMSGQQLNVNILALQRSLYTLLELSNMQEYLTHTASDTRNRSQGFVDLARIQKNVSDQFSIVADTLFQVSAELPGVPNQINRKKLEVEQRLEQTMEQMVDRNQRGSSIATRESLGGINDLASMIASLTDQLMDQQNGGMGSGMSMQQMIQQLQNMSGDQQMLNQQLQDLINDLQGDRLTRDQSERLDQIARQQNEIRRQIQELQQSGALDQGDRMLSELQRMIEEMEDSINDMRGGITDPLMVQRQQNILSRMLNAEESLQQRGEEDEREGTTRLEYERVLPPDMTLEELQQEIRARMQDPNYTRFSEQYQRLIERYFEQLRRLEEQLVQ
jgi:hypothetical protein